MKDKKFKTGTKQEKNIEDGIKKFNSFFGENEQIFPSFRKVSPDFADYCAGFIYGDLFLRKGIDDKTRFLAIIATLIGQGNTGIPLRRYIVGALKAGWTKNEIVEVLMVLTAYVNRHPNGSTHTHPNDATLKPAKVLNLGGV